MGRLSSNSPNESACTTPRKRGVEPQVSQERTSRSSRSSGTFDGWPHTLHVYVGIRSIRARLESVLAFARAYPFKPSKHSRFLDLEIRAQSVPIRRPRATSVAFRVPGGVDLDRRGVMATTR